MRSRILQVRTHRRWSGLPVLESPPYWQPLARRGRRKAIRSVVRRALAGRAAGALEESSGIEERTLASWSYSWDKIGRDLISRGDVFVIDETGMVGSRQLAPSSSEEAGAAQRSFLSGTASGCRQSRPVPSGRSPSRSGRIELSGIRRQRRDWQRQASVAFATTRRPRRPRHLSRSRRHPLCGRRDKAMAKIVRVMSPMAKNIRSTRSPLAHHRPMLPSSMPLFAPGARTDKGRRSQTRAFEHQCRTWEW